MKEIFFYSMTNLFVRVFVSDCISRLLPGVLPSPECTQEESLENGLLEYPQYTRPRVFEGMEVPKSVTTVETGVTEDSIKRG